MNNRNKHIGERKREMCEEEEDEKKKKRTNSLYEGMPQISKLLGTGLIIRKVPTSRKHLFSPTLSCTNEVVKSAAIVGA